MRRPGEATDWDIWMPTLAPSHELLTQYHQAEVTWDEFCDRFHQEVIAEQQEYLDILVEMAQKHVVTILCWEETPEKCHRRLVAEACKQINSELEVIIR